jgi:hypothetical protein
VRFFVVECGNRERRTGGETGMAFYKKGKKEVIH